LNGKSWKKQPLNLGAKKGSGLAARVTVLECFSKPRFDQAGNDLPDAVAAKCNLWYRLIETLCSDSASSKIPQKRGQKLCPTFR
jgi:hypothetical protein